MNEARAPKPKVKGLAVVRDKNGRIRANNYENLSQECKDELRRLVRLDGLITAESSPNPDPRFI